MTQQLGVLLHGVCLPLGTQPGQQLLQSLPASFFWDSLLQLRQTHSLSKVISLSSVLKAVQMCKQADNFVKKKQGEDQSRNFHAVHGLVLLLFAQHWAAELP